MQVICSPRPPPPPSGARAARCSPRWPSRTRPPASPAGWALPRQRLNYHLKALEQCGLLECVEERRKGNCTERILRATARSFVISPDALGALGPTPEAAQDRLSASYVVAVAARTITEVSTLDARARAEQKRLSTLAIDSEIRFASPESRAAFAAELSDRITELVAKYHDDASPARPPLSSRDARHIRGRTSRRRMPPTASPHP